MLCLTIFILVSAVQPAQSFAVSLMYQQLFFVPPQLLLNSGSQADVNKIGSGGLSPLQLAAQSDHAKLCKLLVSKKFNDDI